MSYLTARWVCIFGMLGQPFWLYASWQADQWGIFAVSVLYALAWMKELCNHWIRLTPSSIVAEKIGNIQFVPEVRQKYKSHPKVAGAFNSDVCVCPGFRTWQ